MLLLQGACILAHIHGSLEAEEESGVGEEPVHDRPHSELSSERKRHVFRDVDVVNHETSPTRTEKRVAYTRSLYKHRRICSKLYYAQITVMYVKFIVCF